MVKPLEYVSEVRQEAQKVTWSTRKEVFMSTIMVLLMVSIAALFFGVIDLILSGAVYKILSLGD
jgi:preprotein translocase subunit SecE